MSNLSKQLKGFATRVRVVRAWRGLAIGACLGCAEAAVWAILDWRAVVYTEWSWMGMLVAGYAVFGALAGFVSRVPLLALAESVDRRAGLEDRLTTAQERENGDEPFDLALREDAEEKLATVQPRTVYPIRFGRWHAGALFLGLIAAAIFVLGNTPIGLTDEQRKDREELKRQGEAVKRVTKENFETPEARQEMSDAERRLADEMRRFDKDLERGRLTKEEALQKSNELSQKADDLISSAAKASQQDLSAAQTAREQLEKSELEKAGFDNVSPQMAAMPESERQSRLEQSRREAKQMENTLTELKRRLADLERKLANPSLSSAERKALEAEKAGLKKQISELQAQQKSNSEEQKALELSKEAQEVFRKLANDPLYKQLLELEKKLAQNASAASQSGRPKLTDEERKKLQDALEKLAAQLKDDKARQEYLKALLEAMKKANRMQRCNCAGILPGGNTPLSGAPSDGGNSMEQAPAGPGAPTEDVWMGDSGHIHKLDKAQASQGTTTTQTITGEQRPSTGPQTYVEIRAPSTVGNRTSVPYRDVLPSYKRKAESALNRQEIPKEHQKRVKEYFDSLTGAHKS